MALTSPTVRVQYDGDGATVSFPVSFIFWDADDLTVVHTDTSGTETTWVRGTRYTVTGGSGSTGTIEVEVTPTDFTPATGETLTIKSSLPNTQPTTLPAGGELPSGSIEQALDQAVRLTQQIDETIGRQLTYPISDAAALSAELPNSSDRASKFLGFSATGEPLATAGSVDTIAVSTFMETLLDDITAAAALATLTAAGTGLANTFSGINTFSAQVRWAKGADIASAATLVLGTDGNYFDVTGTTGPITAITVAAGTWFMLQFDSTPILTHHATNLNLNAGGSNITAAAGDRFIGFATGANQVTGFVIRASGRAVNQTADFISSEQTVAYDTVLDVAHGLGAIPSRVEVVLRNDSDDDGYVADDEITMYGSLSRTTDAGMQVQLDATNVTIIQGVTLTLLSQTTLNAVALDVTKWKWVVRAWI